VRPTPDALREQAFAILLPTLADASFLDLFAGTGANSLEALSRGAGLAVLVERAAAMAEVARRNLAAFDVGAERALVVTKDACRAVENLAATGVRCTSGWCDPPFAEWQDGVAALVLARKLGVLVEGAMVVLETPPKVTPDLPGLELVRALRGAFLLRCV
jgi:16S rRNA (guanine(966)-N(2))-methyltransferase RsmD